MKIDHLKNIFVSKNAVLRASEVNKLVGVKKFQNVERSKPFARDWLMTSTVQWICKLNTPTVSSKYNKFEIDLKYYIVLLLN